MFKRFSVPLNEHIAIECQFNAATLNPSDGLITRVFTANAMDLHCTYPSKHCTNPRAVRRNGELHSFCEEHRQKANEAQKRWYTRHRQTQQLPTAIANAMADVHAAAAASGHHHHKSPRRRRPSGLKVSSSTKTATPPPVYHRYGRVAYRPNESSAQETVTTTTTTMTSAYIDTMTDSAHHHDFLPYDYPPSMSMLMEPMSETDDDYAIV